MTLFHRDPDSSPSNDPRTAPELVLGLLNLAATAVAGVCLLVAIPGNREAFSSFITKQVHAATQRFAS